MPKNFFFDTEFCEDGKTIDLISIAIVAEDGREYRAVSNDFDLEKARKNDFIAKNVLPHLSDPKEWKSREQIRNEILEFVGEETPAKFWAYYAASDFVALYQLMAKDGRLMTLPDQWSWSAGDVEELRQYTGLTELPKKEQITHNALDDARWTKQAYETCMRYREYGKASNVGVRF